jgi:integrase
MRRAELAGLRWVDVDLDAARLSPRRPRVVVNYVVHESEPKTRMGKRSLALDPATLAALEKHQARQEQERADVGAAWRDSRLVFTRPDGAPIHPDLITTGSGGWPAAPACRRSGCMTSATAMPPRRWPRGSRPR